jgi:hypothetical protein
MKDAFLDDRTSIQSALHNIIVKFVDRQLVVLEAMRELRPDITMTMLNIGTAHEQQEATKQFHKRRKEEGYSGLGYWGANNEWQYFQHGLGCRLVHTVTQERIEWDLGNLCRFNRFWFVNYLEWLLSTDQSDQDVQVIRSWLNNQLESHSQSKPVYGPIADIVFSLLEEMHHGGLLTQEWQYYTLT